MDMSAIAGDPLATPEASVAALKRGYAALNRGELSVVVDLLHPEIEWLEPTPSPEAGTHRGRDSFERFLRGWLESFERWEAVGQPEEALGDDE
jgi:ketosteroid isomerase-like protein